MFSSLRRSFALVCASLGVTAVGVTGTLSYVQAERALEEASLRALTLGRNEKRDRLHDHIQSHFDALTFAAEGLSRRLGSAGLVGLAAEAPGDLDRLAALRGNSDALFADCVEPRILSLLHPSAPPPGAALRAAIDAVCAGEPSPRIADFELVEREAGQLALAYAVAAIPGVDRPLGALAFELPSAPINAIMTSAEQWSEAGLGSSGEAYLVGADLLMRSDSRFVVERPEGAAADLRAAGLDEALIGAILRERSTILRLPVDTQAARAAQAGRSGTEVLRDYRDIEVLSSYTPLEIPGVRWAIISEIDADEALTPARSLGKHLLVLATALAAILALVGVLLAARVARPLGRLARLAERMGEGELFHRMNIRGSGEIATLALAFDAMAERLAAKQSDLEDEVAYRRELEQAIVTIAEREKRRLGHDLHDGLAQQLAGISLLIQTLQRRAADPEQLAPVHLHVMQAIRTSKLLAHGLYPVDLTAEDIHRALEALADELASLFRCVCTYEGDESVEIDDPEVALHLYRIVQEATANAVRHGAARNVLITLAPQGGDEICLAIQNDGSPLPDTEVPRRGSGMGLRTMEIRASVIGGRLEIRSDADVTRVACVFPRPGRTIPPA